MGFFKKIKKAFKRATKVKKLTLKKVVGATISVAKFATPVGQAVALAKLTGAKKVAAGIEVANAIGTQVIASKVPGAGLALQAQTYAENYAQGGKMAFNLGGFLGAVGGVLGNVQGANAGGLRALGTVTSLVGAGLTPAVRKTPSAPSRSNIPRDTSQGPKTAMVSTGTALISANVANAGQWLLNKMGVRVTSGAAFVPALKRTLAALASFARRTPTGSIVQLLIGMGMGVNLANELISWYATKKKYRRMNPANAKALRRAARRIKSFHRLCQHTDLIKSHRRSAGRSFARCGTCRKSPCRC